MKRNDFFYNKKVLIIGGLGFIGSNLINRLIIKVKEIYVVEKNLKKGSWKYLNNKEFLNKITIKYSDALNLSSYEAFLKDADIIFNLITCLDKTDDKRSNEVNVLFNKKLLEFLKDNNKEALIMHFGSRLQYSIPARLPVNEMHERNAQTIYGKNKNIAEEMFLDYNKRYGIKTVCLRISNPYGPRGLINRSGHNFLNYALGRFLESESFTIYGDGKQIKDYIYIEDLIDAIILLCQKEEAIGQVFNVGYSKQIKFRDAINQINKVINKGKIVFDKKKDSEDYDFLMDISKIHNLTGWIPKTNFKNGIKKTVNYYKSKMLK